MTWELKREERQQRRYILSQNGSLESSWERSASFDMSSISGTSVTLFYSTKNRLYESPSQIEISPFGEMQKLIATFVSVDEEFPRWYLDCMLAFKSKSDPYFLLGWEGHLGIAMFLKILQGTAPHYLDYPQGLFMPGHKDRYMTYSSTDSPETRRQIRTALGELSKVIGEENNLSEIIYSDLLKE